MAFRVLAGGEQPHFTTVNAFRLDVYLCHNLLRLYRAVGSMTAFAN